MKTANMLLLVLAIIFVASISTVWLYPSAKDFMDGNTMWNGINKFSNEFNIAQIDSLNGFTGSYEKKALLVIPYLEYSKSDLAEIKKLVDSGGTVVIMDDFGYGNNITGYLGLKAHFSGDILLDPLFCYKNQNLPRITDFSNSLKAAGINSITLNHATAIIGAQDTDVLARSSEYSFLDTNLNGKEDNGETKGPLAVAAAITVGNGTVILISDPSVIINSMVDMNDNYAFMKYIFSQYCDGVPISLDISHISKSPLDTSKIGLEKFRQMLYNRYVVLGFVILLFVIIALYTFKKEAATIG